MASDGISWGKVVLGIVGIGAAAVLAGPVFTSVSETLLEQASTGSTLETVAQGIGTAGSKISEVVGSVVAGLGGTVPQGAVLTTFSGVGATASAVGDQMMTWVQANQGQAALLGGAAALTGAAVGQWASKAAGTGRRPGAPGGQTYAQYIEARRRAAAMPTQARAT